MCYKNGGFLVNRYTGCYTCLIKCAIKVLCIAGSYFNTLGVQLKSDKRNLKKEQIKKYIWHNTKWRNELKNGFEDHNGYPIQITILHCNIRRGDGRGLGNFFESLLDCVLWFRNIFGRDVKTTFASDTHIEWICFLQITWMIWFSQVGMKGEGPYRVSSEISKIMSIMVD